MIDKIIVIWGVIWAIFGIIVAYVAAKDTFDSKL